MKIKIAFQKPYVYWFILIFIGYLVLNLLLSGFYNTIPLIIVYASTVNWFKLSISLILTLVIGFLVASVSVLTFIRYKERKACKEANALTGVGAIGGFIVGVCPICVTGIFPLILSFLGISFTFGSLPFQGIEIQLLVITILVISLKMLTASRVKKEKRV